MPEYKWKFLTSKVKYQDLKYAFIPLIFRYFANIK